MAELSTNVRYIKGIGEARAKALEKLGITTLRDLIGYFPRTYEDRTLTRPIRDLTEGENVCVRAMIAADPTAHRIPGGRTIVRTRAVDETGTLDVVFFNQEYRKNSLHRGEIYIFYGKVEGQRRHQMVNPLLEPEGHQHLTGRIMPIYSLTAGISQLMLAQAVRQGLDACRELLPDVLPDEVRREHRLCYINYAYENVHFPDSPEALTQARRRLAFEELFLLTCGLRLLRSRREDVSGPACRWVSMDPFYNALPFTLTDAMFDDNGNCIEPFVFDLASPNGIESLRVNIASTSSQFMASMAAIQLPETFDLCALDASSPAGIILKGFGYPVGGELKGQQAKSFNIAGQIKALYEFDGTHTFSFDMTDAKGVSTAAALTLVVDKSAGQEGPAIVWRGYDIDQQYEVQKDMIIDIDVTATAGIKSFWVTIDSEELKDLLPVINMPEKFDICDVPADLAAILHGEFGFPINEQVKNQTAVMFSITKFVEILLEIPGEHNFVLDVTDNNNALTHKTVKLIVKAAE